MKFMTTLAVALGLAGSAFAQEQVAPADQGGFLKSIANVVRADFAVTWDGKEMFLARSDIQAHIKDGRIEVFARINLLPYIAKSTIIDRLKQNEDIINGVSAAIAQTVKNQIAAKFGIPASMVTVPPALLQAAIAQNLSAAVDGFVANKYTSDAQIDAAVRELGFAIALVGPNPGDNQKLVLEVGKLDPMYAQSMDYSDNPTQEQNFFRLSRPAVRLKYAVDSLGLVTYLEVGNDAGLWEVANPQANAAMEYIATVIARSQGKFFDLTNVNSWELGLIKNIGDSQKLVLAYGSRPVLDTGVDSRYLLAKYDIKTGGVLFDFEGSLEKFNDPAFGETIVKRFSESVSKEIKGTNIGYYMDTNYDRRVRKDFTTFMVGANRGLWNFSNFTIGVGAQAYISHIHGVQPDGAPGAGTAYPWDKGFKVGSGITFGKTPQSPADVLFDANQKENAKRLKEMKDAAKKDGGK